MDSNGEGRALSMAVENSSISTSNTGSTHSNNPNGATSSSNSSNNITIINSSTSPTGNVASPVTNRALVNEPTPPRRISSEDEDPARPRKRPATLASVQQIELLNAEHMANSIGFHNPDQAHFANPPPERDFPQGADPTQSPLNQGQQQVGKEDVEMVSPSPVDARDGADVVGSIDNTVTQAATATAAAATVEEQNPPGDTATTTTAATTTTTTGTVTDGAPNTVTDKATIVSNRPLFDEADTFNPLDNGEDYGREGSSNDDSQTANGDQSDSNTTSANYTTLAKLNSPPSEAGASASGSSDQAYRNSPEVEVEELMEEDDDVGIQIMQYLSYPLKCQSDEDAVDLFYQMQQSLDGDPCPVPALFELEDCISKLAKEPESSFFSTYIAAAPAWHYIPKLVNNFLYRTEPFSESDFTQESTLYATNGLQLTLKLFDALLKLTVRFMEIDNALLNLQNPSLGVAPASQIYQTVAIEMFKDSCPLFELLCNSFRVNILSCQVDAIRTFVESCHGVSTSRKLAETLAKLIPEQPGLLAVYVRVVELPQRILAILKKFGAIDMIDLTQEAQPDNRVEQIKQVISEDCLAMILLSVTLLRNLLERNVPAEKRDLNRAIDNTTLLAYSFYVFDPQIGREEFKSITGRDLSDLNIDNSALLIKWWLKLEIHNLGIRSCKKLELRLSCLNAFCEELLSAWNACQMSPDHPLLQCIFKFIQDSKIVEYLFGPQSHFQLVQKSSNVVGYLVVLKSFSDYYRQTIWQPLVENRDKRFVHATIHVLNDLVNNMPHEQHTSNCVIMKSLPLSAWDPPLIDYLQSVLIALTKPFYEPNTTKIDLPVYELLIHLIHEAFAAKCDGTPCGTVNAPAILDFAFRELQSMTQLGPNPEERLAIFDSCISEMKSNSKYAISSVYVLNAFVIPDGRRSIPTIMPMSNKREDLNFLINEMELVPLVVKGVSHCVECQEMPEKTLLKLAPYYEILYTIILYFSHSISSPWSAEIWTYLFGEESRSFQVRENSFTFLSNLMEKINNTDNEFLSTCFLLYFPKLDPSLFVPSSLDYVVKAMDYLRRVHNGKQAYSDDIVEFEGSDQMWRIILNAPQDQLAAKAMTYFVAMYLDSPQITQRSPDVIHATHTHIIRNCINHITSAAGELSVSSEESGLDATADGMTKDGTENDKSHLELQFKRSFSLLTKFLEGHRSRPRYVSTQSIQKGPEFIQRGNPLKLRVQLYAQDSKFTSTVNDITVGDGITGAEFYAFLSHMSGFGELRVLTSGRELKLKDENMDLLSMNLGDGQLLQLMKRPSPVENAGTPTGKVGLTFAESETLTHFDKLYDLLRLPERYCNPIWCLLRQFPPQDQVLERILPHGGGFEDILPQDYPFQVLYSLYCVKHALANERVRESHGSFPARVVNWLTRFLTTSKLSGPTSIQLTQLCDLLEDLSIALNSTSSPAESLSFAAENGRLVNKLLGILKDVARPELQGLNNPSMMLIVRSFETLLAACQFHASIWETLKSDERFKTVVSLYLLRDQRPQIRQNFKKNINKFCETAPPNALSQENNIAEDGAEDSGSSFTALLDFPIALWTILNELLPGTFETPQTAAELFETAHSLLVRLIQGAWPGLDLESYLQEWCNVLTQAESRNVAGGLLEGSIVNGYATLLIACMRTLKELGRPLNSYKDVPQLLYERYLFPSPVDSELQEDPSLVVQKNMPLMDELARARLYELMSHFLSDTSAIAQMIQLEANLMDEVFDDGLNVPFNVDRTRWLRAPGSYVGLRNQSNTCYLNSLLTQLFMNFKFRNFVLEFPIKDMETQKLLYLAQELFGNLEKSMQKSFEPREFTMEIKDYENQPIDVTVQMDVDEFYNLLFDRLEGQMESSDEKKVFRQFYGGELVQQMKCKECDHVSEKVEAFSAIQCDIKGKQNLQESLRAYVEGESMDGDNKYSCSGCHRHVDAVKRTCLKNIPNHLIFHLKRFDYDLRAMLRSKINDYFEFPSEINMRPYTIDALADSNKNQELEPDIFDLVGVLVHSGTAESGHYYSYIKDRQNSLGGLDSRWYEFNDSEVSIFDPNTIPAQCYGGSDTHTTKDMMSPITIPKPYSAYMLFYERRSSMQNFSVSTLESKVPKELTCRINHENELTIRRYYLFDPRHLGFTIDLVRRLKFLEGGRCSEDHVLETSSLKLLFDTLFSVAGRIKDCLELDDYYSLLTELFNKCSECSHQFCKWLLDRPEGLRTVLLRNTVQKNRRGWGNLLLTAYKRLYADEMDPSGPKFAEYSNLSFDIFRDIVGFFKGFFEFLYAHTRAWDDYFELLGDFALLSPFEARYFIQENFLRKCIEILLIDYVPRSTRLEFGNLWRLIEKGRKFQYGKMMDFIRVLLDNCDYNEEPVDDEDRDTEFMSANEDDSPLPLTKIEFDYLKFSVKKMGICFIYKPLDQSCNVDASSRILKRIVEQQPDWIPMSSILKTLYNGVCVDPAHMAEPFLKALVAVVGGSRSLHEVGQIIKRVSQEVTTIGQHGGKEHLDFFQNLLRLRDSHVDQDFIRSKVVETLPEWGPVLLTYWEQAVRDATECFVSDLIFSPPEDETENARVNRLHRTHSLVIKCFEWTDARFLKNKTGRVDQKRFTSVLKVLEAGIINLKGTEQINLLEYKFTDLQTLLDKVIAEDEPYAEDWANSDNDMNSDSHSIDIDNDYNSA